MSRSRCKLERLAAAALGLLPLADVGAEWSVSGENHLRLESYHNAGDRSASPYAHDGFQSYDRFNLLLRDRPSLYESQNLGLNAIWNESRYQFEDSGFHLDRLQFNWEKGDAKLPFRLEAGDLFVGFSPLTAQTSLKGVLLDLQPVSSRQGRRHSVQLFLGTRQSDWHDLQFREAQGSGLSWLIEDDALGALGLNWLQAHHPENPGQGNGARMQQLASLAWLRPFDTFSQHLELEGEFAWLKGEHSASGGAERNGGGGFLELSARHDELPLDYRLRWEDYDADFRPDWGAITPNHRALTFNGRWRFDTGHRLRWRAERHEDGVESGNPLVTHTAGLGLYGAFPASFNGAFNLLQSDRENDDRSTDSLTRQADLRLNRRLSEHFSMNAGLRWQRTQDETTAGEDSLIHSADLGLTYSGELAGWRARLSPGWRAVKTRGGQQTVTEHQPRLSLGLFKGPHDFSLNLHHSDRNVIGVGNGDVDLSTFDALYRYRRGPHILALDINRFDRDPEGAGNTRAWRAGLTWQYAFDHTPSRRPVTPLEAAGPVDAEGTLLDFAPGISRGRAEAALLANGISAVASGNRLVADYPLLDELQLDQQLILEFRGDTLASARILIDFGVGNSEQVFHEVRSWLAKEYGRPVRQLEKGEFSDPLEPILGFGELIRNYEWDTPSGPMRFGMPYTPGTNAHMELVLSHDLPQLSEPRWGLNP